MGRTEVTRTHNSHTLTTGTTHIQPPTMIPLYLPCLLLFLSLLQHHTFASPVDYTTLEEALRDLLRSEVSERSGRVQRSEEEADPGRTALTEAGLQADPLRVSAFNIQIFGANKLKRPGVKDSLIKILGRYDLILIQEIRDSNSKTFLNFFKDLKKVHGPDLSFKLSGRQGRSTSKEQYAYIYKPSRLTVKQTYQSTDRGVSGISGFERPPYCVHFTTTDSALESFGVIGIHTKPSDANGEIDRLANVYDTVSERFDTKNIILMGDFNAGCSYVTDAEWSDIRLRTDPRFTWLIADDVDTTVANSDCAYDRFVTAGAGLKAAVVKGSAKTYRFDLTQGLDAEMTESVSDHYPIELEIYGKVDPLVTAALTQTSFTINSPEGATVDILDLVQKQRKTSRYFANLKPTVQSVDGQDVVFLTRTTDCTRVISYIQKLGDWRDELMSPVVVGLVKTYMTNGEVLMEPVVPGLVRKVVKSKRKRAPKPQCEIRVKYTGRKYEVKITKNAQG